MTTQEPISPELQAKIDALPEGNVKKRVIRALTGPGIRAASNEAIFETIMKSVAEAQAQRAQWRQWRDDEVLAFVDHFKQEMPKDYAEYMRQQHEDNQIDGELSLRVSRLAIQWIPGLDYQDCTLLLGKLRDYFRSIPRSGPEMLP